MVTENQPPAADANGNVDAIINDALASVPSASPPIPGQQASTEPPAAPPDLGVPSPTTVPEGSTPPPDASPTPLTPDAIALQERDTQIAELLRAGQARDQLLQQYQAEQRTSQVAQTSNQLAQQLVNDGVAPERAQQYAQYLATSQIQGQDQARESAAKSETVRKFAQQYGVPETSLVDHVTPQAMEAAAKQGAEILSLQKQITDLRQGQLPAQTFDSGLGLSTGTTMAQKQAASGRGEYTYTPDELAERTAAALAKIGGR